MKLRVTNNSEIETDDIAGVFPSRDGYRVVLKDGTAKQWRGKMLTQEAREMFAEIAQPGELR